GHIDGASVAIILTLVMLITSFLFQALSKKTCFHSIIRRCFADYGMPISLVAASGMAYWGRFNSANSVTSPVGAALQATNYRAWLSLIAQGSQFPLRKLPGFHYDFFLLGITTFVAGLIGVPAPNGLIPQAPIHTTSLLVMGHPSRKVDEEGQADTPASLSDVVATRIEEKGFDPSKLVREVPVGVVEQRVSNLAQGALCLVLLPGSFPR
ncbi:hypothetical protein PAXINDRAFT_166591, partial [Paxillus involutus ATCC 200175]